jgi:hypothetical protein
MGPRFLNRYDNHIFSLDLPIAHGKTSCKCIHQTTAESIDIVLHIIQGVTNAWVALDYKKKLV